MAQTSPALARFRLILWVLVAVVAIAATALFLFQPVNKPVGVFGGPFVMESTKGGNFTEQDLKGTPSLVFFGFTYCPDVCPTTLAETAVWREKLGLDGTELRTIFVTVDPERDTKQMLTDYLAGFDANAIGLVGTPEETEATKTAFGVFSEKVGAPDDPFYLVNHTASVFLIDANGAFQSTIAYGESQDTALGKIRRLVGR
jgi:protein SCO1/2